MADPIERALAAALNDRCRFGEILIQRSTGNHFVLCHRDDSSRADLERFESPDDAIAIARFDDAGNYRRLKTAPNLRRGWRLEVLDLAQLRRALDFFYPARLAVFAARQEKRLTTTPLRETLGRQSGMYRVAATISDEQIDQVVARFCRSDDGCLRTILWKRNSAGEVASTQLPATKFDPSIDQAGKMASMDGAGSIPLLCQEACNLLVNECRKAVK